MAAVMQKPHDSDVKPQEVEQATTWKYLAPRPESWKKQLFFKDSRMTAANLWLDMLANSETPEQAAADWDLPLEAVLEAIRYCEANEELIYKEAEEQKRILIENGMWVTYEDLRRKNETASR